MLVCMSRPPAVSLVGSSVLRSPEIGARCRELGAALRTAGYTLVCGGRGGVMEATCEGFAGAEGPGVCVGILPEADLSGSNEFLDVALPTGLGLTRNALVAMAGQAVIAVGGGSGTLSEIAFAWQFGKPIVAVTFAGGWAEELAGRHLDDRFEAPIARATTVPEVLAFLRPVLTTPTV